MSAHVAMSQDVIVTKQSERIDGKVEEISETEIKYRPKTNPTGPLMVISASKVATIMFENGQVYSPENNELPTDDNQSVQQAANSQQQTQEKNKRIIVYQPGKPIRYSNNKYWYDDLFMSEAGYKTFIRNHCEEAWRVYRRRTVWGKLAFWGGPAIMLLDLCFLPVSLKYETLAGTMCSIMIPLGIGIITTFAIGFPLWNSAGRASVKKFNSTCGSPDYKTTLSLNAAPTGFGLTLNF